MGMHLTDWLHLQQTARPPEALAVRRRDRCTQVRGMAFPPYCGGGVRYTAAQGAALGEAARFDREGAWNASRVAAWDASRVAAWVAAWDAAEDALWLAGGRAAWAVWDAWVVARGTAAALVVWELITPDQRDILTEPIRTALPDLWAEVSSRLPDIR